MLKSLFWIGKISPLNFHWIIHTIASETEISNWSNDIIQWLALILSQSLFTAVQKLFRWSGLKYCQSFRTKYLMQAIFAVLSFVFMVLAPLFYFALSDKTHAVPITFHSLGHTNRVIIYGPNKQRLCFCIAFIINSITVSCLYFVYDSTC